jgi:diguanylate cyclase (GGDEF)-like protein
LSEEGPDRRISRYTDLARAIGRGEYDARVPDGGDDALGELGRALGEMSAAIRRRVEERARLAELADKVNAGLTLEDVLGHVFESFRSVIPYQRIGFAALDEDRSTLRAVWARSAVGPMSMPIGYRGRLQGSSLSRIMETGRPRILNDLPAYLAEHPSSDSTRLIVAEGLRSSLTCPLIASGHAVGFLFFSSVASGTYADVHVGLFERIAGQLAVIVEKGRLYEELARTKRDLEAANKKLHELAAQDALTGLPNRRSLDERLEEAWRRAVRTRAPLALVLADVDHFKAYNDANGHQLGDDCLKRVAAAFAEELKRPDDFVARYGGEEFLVILENMDAAGAIGMAERLREAVAALGIPHLASAPAGMVTVSLGVAATNPRRDGSATDLLAEADRWLYRAKSAGRNRVASASHLAPGLLAKEETSVEP